MKKNIKRTVIASMLAIGLVTGTAIAHVGTNTTNQPYRQMHGNMMDGCMINGGMMGMRGNMMGGGMMGMHGNMMGNGMWNEGNWGMGCAGMMGGTMMYRMTPAQQQAFMDQTADLRKQMMEKRFTYMEAMRNPNTTPQQLASVEKDMLDLRTKMMDKMNSVQSK